MLECILNLQIYEWSFKEHLVYNVEHATLHDLRRSFGTYLASTESRMHVVSAVLGHSNIQTTTRHYVWAQEQEMRESMAGFRIGKDRLKRSDTTKSVEIA